MASGRAVKVLRPTSSARRLVSFGQGLAFLILVIAPRPAASMAAYRRDIAVRSPVIACSAATRRMSESLCPVNIKVAARRRAYQHSKVPRCRAKFETSGLTDPSSGEHIVTERSTSFDVVLLSETTYLQEAIGQGHHRPYISCSKNGGLVCR